MHAVRLFYHIVVGTEFAMKRVIPVVLILTLLAGGCWSGWYWLSIGRFIEKTDNAYIRSEITQISSKVSGYVKAVPAGDNAPVAAGDPLVRIEDIEFRVKLENGRKRLEERRAALRVAQVKSRLQQSRIDACTAQVAAAEAEQVKRGSELRRFSALFPSGIVSELDYEAVVTTEKKARADAAGARANLESAEREREVFLAEERRLEAELRQLEEELKLPAQELGDTVIRAPIAGVVGNRRVRPGQYVKPGTVLLAVIPRDDIWVEANFKEVQLARMREGQPVAIEVDTFPGTPLTGRVESLAPASGAEFSLIPPENATGNFTKIVQRVPVKIRFDAGQPLLQSLRAGMSVVVKLDTRFDPGAGSTVSRMDRR
ncbi:MAG: multidrug resistance protein [Geobacteraceae bacterium]|nr:MAG: multidrug resistance protein [Geobacteraceae bacterium]